MNSGKHILILTPGFPENEADSTCIPPLQAFVQTLAEHTPGIALSLVAVHYPFAAGFYSWNGISCYAVGGRNKGWPLRLQTWKHVIDHVKNMHRQTPVSLIHSFWMDESGYLGSLLSRLTGIPHVTQAMGREVLKGNLYLRLPGWRQHAIVANSPLSAASLAANYGRTADAIIPFGIRSADFSKNQISNNRHIDILGVGSLTDVKRFDIFIELFEKLRRERPHLKGVIVGAGPLESALKTQIARAGMGEALTLTGRLPRQEVLTLMQQSKILLHTAPYESAGYVFLEALQSGMGVVAFHTGYLPVGNSVMPGRNDSELLEGLRTMLSKDTLPPATAIPRMEDTVAEAIRVYESVWE